MSLCSATGKKQAITFNFPVGVAGRDTDAQFSLQIQQARIANPQQALAFYAAYLAAQKPVTAPMPTPITPLPPPSTTRVCDVRVETTGGNRLHRLPAAALERAFGAEIISWRKLAEERLGTAVIGHSASCERFGADRVRGPADLASLAPSGLSDWSPHGD